MPRTSESTSPSQQPSELEPTRRHDSEALLERAVVALEGILVEMLTRTGRLQKLMGPNPAVGIPQRNTVPGGAFKVGSKWMTAQGVEIDKPQVHAD